LAYAPAEENTSTTTEFYDELQAVYNKRNKNESYIG
jgi:hypothetical protein